MTAFVAGLVAGAVSVLLAWVGSAWAEHVATVRGAAEDEAELEAWRRLKAEEAEEAVSIGFDVDDQGP